jgi:SSS family solute:Na+ symporter
MNIIDYLIFGLYMLAVLSVGAYFFFKNRHSEDYYVANREMGATHVGLSIVATDVGGGFSIGLGGVGFLMGLAGSWLLFTGLVGAWLSAVFIVPRIKKIDTKYGWKTYPDFLRHRYGRTVAMIAALISGIGYLGFTGGQIRAGATLAGATIFTNPPWGISPTMFSLVVIAVVTIAYTCLGGLKAVIYTDMIQWIVLLGGLVLVTIPVTIYKLGGPAKIIEALPEGHMSFANIEAATFINWMIAIIPIWLVAMTLYQRMFACRDTKTAKRAWYIAGLLEYPCMAFAGVLLGMCARVAFPELPAKDCEQGLPMLIANVLPIGVTGIVIAAYFSAIMSTADSCMMASSGNFVHDIIGECAKNPISEKTMMRLSIGVTFLIGVAALALAAVFTTVLSAIVMTYEFMVAGLFIPTLGAFFWRKGSSLGALLGMVGGGGTTLTLMILQKTNIAQDTQFLKWIAGSNLSVCLHGIVVSLVLYIIGSLIWPNSAPSIFAVSEEAMTPDHI